MKKYAFALLALYVAASSTYTAYQQRKFMKQREAERTFIEQHNMQTYVDEIERTTRDLLGGVKGGQT